MKKLTTLMASAVLMAGAANAGELSLQNAFPKGLALVGPSADYFADLVRVSTGNEIDFKHYGSGELSPPADIVDNVGSGALDAGWSYAAYTAGKAPAVTLFGTIPFGPDARKYLTWIHRGGGLELWAEIYEPFNVVPMPCGVTLAESGGWFNDPIETVDDFQGLKMRMGGIGGQVIAKLGASAQSLPAGEIYTSLETGRLDATEFSFPEIDALLGFNKIVKNYYFPGWHQPAGLTELTINKDLWNGWSDDQRNIIINACKATTLEFLELHAAKQHEVLATFVETGVTIRRFPDAVLAALHTAADEVYAEESAKDPMFKKVYDSYQAFSANYDSYVNLNDIN
ncbi:TRAP transporter substrate-binding protein [uncultured Sulfitobacter sp.]|uniref:TRAP transporter substrate-binding protein n=1 Tax=uncultured Sulfitobacter sp. TaxID=191468 RepID=UPI002596321A|nr:TRAP transporter substrate-binding protein [uncultured Sulfitobacter sp.]